MQAGGPAEAPRVPRYAHRRRIGDTADRLTNQLGDAAARLIGARAGAAVKETLRGHGTAPNGTDASPGDASSDNALAKGAKGIGHGFKKLFRR
jgi:hypothetical protein